MEKRLRIGIMLSSDTSYASGIPAHVLYLSEELRKRGHVVHIFGSQKTIYPFKNYHEIGHVTNVPFVNGGYGPIMTALPDVNAVKLIKKYKLDLFHVHDPYVPFLNFEIVPQLEMPIITTFHVAWQDNSIVSPISQGLYFFRDYFAENADGVIFVSEGTKKCWQPLVKKNVPQTIIYNGVGSEYTPPAVKQESKDITLVYMGRLVKRKGIMYLLEAMKFIKAKHKNVKLVVIGTGPELEKATKYVKEHNLGKIVKFTGELMGEEKIKVLQQADIFCASYTHEAFALTILESMACGVPVVGFWDKGIDRALTGYPHKNKVLIHDRDGEKLAKVLGMVIEDKELRKELSDWSIEQSKKFTWQKVVDETEKFYEMILSK